MKLNFRRIASPLIRHLNVLKLDLHGCRVMPTWCGAEIIIKNVYPSKRHIYRRKTYMYRCKKRSFVGLFTFFAYSDHHHSEMYRHRQQYMHFSYTGTLAYNSLLLFLLDVTRLTNSNPDLWYPSSGDWFQFSIHCIINRSSSQLALDL